VEAGRGGLGLVQLRKGRRGGKREVRGGEAGRGRGRGRKGRSEVNIEGNKGGVRRQSGYLWAVESGGHAWESGGGKARDDPRQGLYSPEP
jgi:hypothetical protein